MDIENKLDGQDDLDPEEGKDNQPDNTKEGEGDDTSKVKIGDAEYTTEELTKIVEKGNQYDELLPDYTKKSQRLAEIEKIKDSERANDNIPAFTKEGWEPQTYKELQEAILWAKETGKNEALATLEKQKEEMDEKKIAVNDFFAEVKKSDKDFDEQDFSEFVIKHTKGKDDITIADVRAFHSVYKEVQEAKKLGEDNALKNKANRNEKVGSGGGKGETEIDFSDLRGKGDIRDIARSAFERIK